MLTNRQIKLIFLESAIILVSVYIIIFILTSALDDSRINAIQTKIVSSSLDHDSSVVMTNFFEVFGSKDCDLLKKSISDQAEQLKTTREDLNRFSQRSLDQSLRWFSVQKRGIFLSQIDLMNLISNHNEVCEEKIHLITYFVDGEDTGLDRQGLILEQFSLLNENVVVLTFDFAFDDEEIVNNIKRHHDIRSPPFIIFNNVTSNDLQNTGIINIRTLNELLQRFE